MLFGVVHLKAGQEILIQIAKTFLVINIFSLLPIYPMDGGQFVSAVLFSRNRKVELGFQIVMALVLAGLSFFLKKPVFALLAIIVFMSLFRISLISAVAETVRSKVPAGQALSVVPPLSCITRIREELIQKEVFRRLSSEGLAAHVLDVWGRVCRKPPKMGAAFGLLFLYLTTLIAGVFLLNVK